MGELAIAESPMGYLTSHERRTEQLRARVTKSIMRGIERLAAVWTAVERERTGDEELQVTESDVVNRLLELGLDGAWAEIGHEPKTDAEVEEMKGRAEKILAAVRAFEAKKK